MQVLDNHYLNGINFYKNTKPMHDLKTNFDKILPLVINTVADQLNQDDNLQDYPRKPALSDHAVLCLSLLQEALGIDSERWFWRKLQSDYANAFPTLPHLSNYNRRRKRLAERLEQLASRWGQHMRLREDTFLVDSIPIPVAHIAREHTTSVCREQFQTAPDKGYSAIFDQYYLGYKLHLVISLRGVYHSMDLTKASVHDARYLKDIKHSGLHQCLLLADKGYLSARMQTDLFETCTINLQTLMRGNQHHFRPWPNAFRTARRRVETSFSQLCEQMMLKRNYAKTFAGLRTRIGNKIASVTLLQFINSNNNKPINHIKTCFSCLV